MEKPSYAEARKTVEDLQRACLVLKKCRSLSPEDLKGKYRKAHEKAIGECTEAVKQCIMVAAPWGCSIWDSNLESVRIWLREFRESEEYGHRLAEVESLIVSGDYEGIMDFLRWLRKKFVELARMGGVVESGGEKILE